MTLSEKEIENMAFEALNAACLSIQEALGVKTGDTAGMFFSGETGECVNAVFASYIHMELAMKGDS